MIHFEPNPRNIINSIKILRMYLLTLSVKDRRLILDRLGICLRRPKSYGEISKKEGVSKPAIKKRETKIWRHLLDHISSINELFYKHNKKGRMK